MNIEGMRLRDIIKVFSEWCDDSYVDFRKVSEWKRSNDGYVLGYFPVYFPVELCEALDILPVALYGSSGRINLDVATAHTQSFVCSICKSVFQLGADGRLEPFDILAFSNICDVARNLSGVMKRNFGDKEVIYIHYPVNNVSRYALEYLVEEYKRIISILERVSGRRLKESRLRDAIRKHNSRRMLQGLLMNIRVEKPWLIPYTEYYTVMRAGSIMPVDLYNKLLEEYIRRVVKRRVRPADRVRILIKGNFCEQPPLMYLKTIEDAGCYIIDDESMISQYWIKSISLDGDPIEALARAYIENKVPLTVRFHPEIDKQKYILSEVERLRVEGTLFLSPKFCEPSLYDYILYKTALERVKHPHLHLEYEETTYSYEHLRTMVETFVESILF